MLQDTAWDADEMRHRMGEPTDAEVEQAAFVATMSMEERTRPAARAVGMVEPSLWVVPWGYDYHGQAMLIVAARTADEAKTRARKAWDAWVEDTGRDEMEAPQFDDVRAAKDARVHFDMGCDC